MQVHFDRSHNRASRQTREEASGAVRRERTADSRSKTASLARKVFKVKFSQHLQLEKPKIASRTWARPNPSDARAVLVVTRDETRAQQLAPKKVHSTHRSENNIPLMRSLKWKESPKCRREMGQKNRKK